jgi:palmitoyl-protein thioesterase
MIKFLSLLFLLYETVMARYPIAIFHGINDSCSSMKLGHLAILLMDQIPDVYVSCIESTADKATLFTPISIQARRACELINRDKNFHGDFSIVAESQGSLVARYIIEACEMPGRVLRYVSIGGPQMGVGKVPHCETGLLCDGINELLHIIVYNQFVQDFIGPAGYFKDVRNYKEYLDFSSFLADLNNERSVKKSSYRDRMILLEKTTFIKFKNDTMVIPKQSAWFEFYDRDMNIVPLESSEFYQEDYIGIKELVINGRASFIELPGEHVIYTDEEVVKYMVPIVS